VEIKKITSQQSEETKEPSSSEEEDLEKKVTLEQARLRTPARENFRWRKAKIVGSRKGKKISRNPSLYEKIIGAGGALPGEEPKNFLRKGEKGKRGSS